MNLKKSWEGRQNTEILVSLVRMKEANISWEDEVTR